MHTQPRSTTWHSAGMGSASLQSSRGPLENFFHSPWGELKVWDTATGQPLMTIDRLTKGTYCVAFSPDGERIASGGSDVVHGRFEGETPAMAAAVQVWNAVTGQLHFSVLCSADYVTSIAFSPDGTRLVAGCSNGLMRMWESKTGKQIVALRGHTEAVSGIAFSSDGRRLISGSVRRGSERGDIKVWDVATGQEVLLLKGVVDGSSTIAFSADSRQIGAGNRDGTVQIWETTNRLRAEIPLLRDSPCADDEHGGDGMVISDATQK